MEVQFRESGIFDMENLNTKKDFPKEYFKKAGAGKPVRMLILDWEENSTKPFRATAVIE